MRISDWSSDVCSSDLTSVAAAVVALAGIVVLGVFVRLLSTCRPEERGPLAACLVLTVQTMIFFLFYQQMSTSLTLFALRNVEHHLAGLAVPPAQFQVLNPLWIMALSPLLAAAYGRAGALGRDPSLAATQASSDESREGKEGVRAGGNTRGA